MTRHRRTAEELISDLETKIQQLKQRAATQEAKASPEGKAFLGAVKAIDKAIEVASAGKNSDLVRALEASRAPLAEQLVKMGLRMPDRKGRRGRRRKGEAA